MLTTRFTTETYQENKRYRENNQIPAIYSTSLPISDKLPYQDYYVLEMNNSTNKIVGISKISKNLQPVAKIYSYKYYNRYTYKGDTYVSAEEFSPKLKTLIEEIEQKIFYGKGHLKRGSSFTSFPAFPHKKYIPQIISELQIISKVKI
jgi:hypothetical protein